MTIYKFKTNQKPFGNCVHELEILSLAKIERMARILNDNNDKMFSPLGRARDLGSLIYSLL